MHVVIMYDFMCQQAGALGMNVDIYVAVCVHAGEHLYVSSLGGGCTQDHVPVFLCVCGGYFLTSAIFVCTHKHGCTHM